VDQQQWCRVVGFTDGFQFIGQWLRIRAVDSRRVDGRHRIDLKDLGRGHQRTDHRKVVQREKPPKTMPPELCCAPAWAAKLALLPERPEATGTAHVDIGNSEIRPTASGSFMVCTSYLM